MRNSSSKALSRAVDEIGKIIDSHFPFPSRQSRETFRHRVRRLQKKLANRQIDAPQFFLLLQYLLASLYNSHTRLGQYPTRVWCRPPGYETRSVGQKIFLWRGRQLLGQVFSVDGRSCISVIRGHVRRISGSTPESRLHQAAKFMLFTNRPGTATTRYRRRHRLTTLTVPRRRNRQIMRSETSRYRLFRNNIGYWWIPSWHNTPKVVERLERDIRAIARRVPRMLLIDVRANGGGSGHVAGTVASHFFKRRVPFGSVAIRIPGRTLRMREQRFVVKPTPPFFSMPVVLLTGIECQSATEYFVAGLKDNGRAVTVGQRTGGSSGNPRRFSVTYGQGTFDIYVAIWRYTRPNGQPLEGKGIVPDITVPLRPDNAIPRPLTERAVAFFPNVVGHN